MANAQAAHKKERRMADSDKSSFHLHVDPRLLISKYWETKQHRSPPTWKASVAAVERCAGRRALAAAASSSRSSFLISTRVGALLSMAMASSVCHNTTHPSFWREICFFLEALRLQTNSWRDGTGPWEGFRAASWRQSFSFLLILEVDRLLVICP